MKALVRPAVSVLGVLLFAFGHQLGIFDNKAKQVEVPSVVGDDQDLARQKLENLDLKVQVTPSPSDQDEGEVLRQDPETGVRVDVGSVVKLTVSSGPDTVTIPPLAGFALPDALKALDDAGITKDRIDVVAEDSDQLAPGTVIRTVPGAGAQPKDTRVTVVVASQAPTTTTEATTTTQASTTTTSTTTTQPSTTTTRPTTTTSSSTPTSSSSTSTP